MHGTTKSCKQIELGPRPGKCIASYMAYPHVIPDPGYQAVTRQLVGNFDARNLPLRYGLLCGDGAKARIGTYEFLWNARFARRSASAVAALFKKMMQALKDTQGNLLLLPLMCILSALRLITDVKFRQDKSKASVVVHSF